ncbi:MAG: diguanylate cyclase [Pseudomonadota bacterium]
MTEPVHLCLPSQTLDAVMPMHLLIASDGKIRHVGPTLRKVLVGGELVGTSFLDHFEVVRPRGDGHSQDLARYVNKKMRLQCRHGSGLVLRASLHHLSGGNGFLLTASFGISVVAAVGEHGLTAADFSPNDPTVEMLYLAEANAAAMREARRLIGRLQTARDTAQDASLTDPLTGLQNRRGLEDAADARFQSGQDFTLLLLDLDYFKSVNDSHGHAAGDAVLVAVAERLQRCLRPSDLVARVGGDEFVVLLNPPIKVSDTLRMAERIIEAIEAPIHFDGLNCHVSASVGFVGSSDYEVPTLEDMLRDADAALYKAKTGGRGQAFLGTPSGPGQTSLAPMPRS